MTYEYISIDEVRCQMIDEFHELSKYKVVSPAMRPLIEQYKRVQRNVLNGWSVYNRTDFYDFYDDKREAEAADKDMEKRIYEMEDEADGLLAEIDALYEDELQRRDAIADHRSVRRSLKQRQAATFERKAKTTTATRPPVKRKVTTTTAAKPPVKRVTDVTGQFKKITGIRF